MYNQESLFDLGLDSYQPPEEKKKKTSTKGAQEKKTGSTVAKKKKETVFTLPLTIIAPTWSEQLTSIGEKNAGDTVTLTEVGEHLFHAGYKCVAHKDVVFLTEKAEDGLLYVATKPASTHPQMDVQLFSASDSVSIAIDGMASADYSLDSFPDKSRDEVTLTDLLVRFVENYNEFTGCMLNFDVESGIILPQFNAVKTIQSPCQVKGLGSEPVMMEETDVDIIIKEVLKPYSPPAKARFSFYENGNGILVPVFTATAYDSFDRSSLLKAKGAKDKKAKEYYHLPLTLNLVLYGIRHELTPEDFGKEKISQKELVDYLKGPYPIFLDPSRTPVWHYLESQNILGVGFESGKKGYQAEPLYETEHHDGPCKMIRSLKDFLAAKAARYYYGTFYADERENDTGSDITVFSSSLACITGRNEGLTRFRDLEFDLRIPKIPKTVLDEVISYFREDLTKEAVVRIYYNMRKESWSIMKPEKEQSNRHFTIYSFLSSVAMATEKEEEVLACEIHSHNTFPAYFSAVDDTDEQGIGFYGVIGELDKPVPSMELRLAFTGNFLSIDWSELVEI